MGFFSWRTSDTKRSIPSKHSCRDTFPVTMVLDQVTWRESQYEGYGVFGGKDIFVLITEANNLCNPYDTEQQKRSVGIKATFENNPDGEFSIASEKFGLKFPKFFENYPNELGYNCYPDSEVCEYQGFFYPEGDE